MDMERVYRNTTEMPEVRNMIDKYCIEENDIKAFINFALIQYVIEFSRRLKEVKDYQLTGK